MTLVCVFFYAFSFINTYIHTPCFKLKNNAINPIRFSVCCLLVTMATQISNGFIYLPLDHFITSKWNWNSNKYNFEIAIVNSNLRQKWLHRLYSNVHKRSIHNRLFRFAFAAIEFYWVLPIFNTTKNSVQSLHVQTHLRMQHHRLWHHFTVLKPFINRVQAINNIRFFSFVNLIRCNGGK